MIKLKLTKEEKKDRRLIFSFIVFIVLTISVTLHNLNKYDIYYSTFSYNKEKACYDVSMINKLCVSYSFYNYSEKQATEAASWDVFFVEGYVPDSIQINGYFKNEKLVTKKESY